MLLDGTPPLGGATDRTSRGLAWMGTRISSPPTGTYMVRHRYARRWHVFCSHPPWHRQQPYPHRLHTLPATVVCGVSISPDDVRTDSTTCRSASGRGDDRHRVAVAPPNGGLADSCARGGRRRRVLPDR